ncbi:DUF3263 domain-containing protein [Microbacterium sp. HSID17254]|uniref:DUF3263 domain-containing protein n=1 Tax=Microbacterium sp. HSID17254 TaxID=2419509 RepID=UPI000F88AB59|nr:DUF3263 domain-containing protein [Microbacterium sp. HSID17254]
MSVVAERILVVTPSDLLAFEARFPVQTPAKTHAIDRELGLGPARYYQLLIRAASSRDGVSADPITARHVRERPVQATRRHVCTPVCQSHAHAR